jgi:hypothetical protein
MGDTELEAESEKQLKELITLLKELKGVEETGEKAKESSARS